MKYIIAFATIATTTLSAHTEPETVYELPPVVVTGELWESELEKATASITLLGGEQLQASGSTHFQDIINSIPNVTWTAATSRPRYIQIRGIGENSQFEGETPDSSVRFLVDDLDFTGIGTIGNLFDVQQVEVLRGPQAGAYGVNAAGGVIKTVTNQPTSFWTGQIEGSLGEDNLRAGGLAIGGPILAEDSEQLTFRFSLHQQNSDGFRDNRSSTINRDDTNERDELTTRLKVRWVANGNWQWDGTLFYADADNGYDEFTLGNTGFDTFSDQPGRDEQESLAGSSRGTWTGLDQIEVVSITSYTATDSYYSFDGDWTDAATAAGLFGSSFLEINRDRDVLSQEFRLNSTDEHDALGFIDRWTAGAYYQHFDESTLTTGFGDFETDYTSETLSLYGQATHEFSQKTRLTLGLRVEHFDLDTDIESRDDVNFDDWLLGGKLTLEHELNSNHTTFASITKGYKAGGANLYPFLASNLPDSYETEDLWNYEVGLRSKWFDGTVTSSLTFFYLDRDNAQLRDSDGQGISFTYFTTNGNDARHYGLESETTWWLNKNWSLTASFGLLETDRDRYPDPGTPGLFIESRDLSNAPLYTYSARIDYNADSGIFSNLEIAGSDEYFESNSHNEERNSYTLVNAAIGYRHENWTLTLWAKNLFNEDYEKRVFFFDNGLGENRYESPADPQQLGATLNYSW